MNNASKPKVLGLIPARGGSKGVPRKNIRELCGKPLIAWTIEAALNADCLDRVVVSTEDDEIAGDARQWGAAVPFVRPAELAQDNSLRNQVVAHALQQLPGFDYVILLQPTSPLRNSLHIEEAFQFFIEQNAPACVSVSEQHPSPYWMFNVDEHRRLKPLLKRPNVTNRQGLPKVYALNGAIYICNTRDFQISKTLDPFLTSKTLAYEMPARFSWDIDEEWEWPVLERLIEMK